MVLRITPKFRYRDGASRKFYGCSRFPDCCATHGAHPDGRPVGTPANIQTKKARMVAHVAFDEWRFAHSHSKTEAYKWLAGELGVPEKEAHMGQMNKVACEAVVVICSQYKRPVEGGE